MTGPPARPLAHSGAVLALMLVIGTSGCGLGDARPLTIRAADIVRPLESTTAITLRPVRPPIGSPGLPELATTLTGGTPYESLTVFVFFSPEATKRVLGGGRRPAGTTVLVRSNVVVLYRVARGATDKSRQVRRVLNTVITGA